ncbi:hypothetical protein Ade02nite_60380 [Paractinoplanes deccanensis]|uniref:Uncharacterized protein n=1 Tax=Paractinoplanes deccanensis TaxID=113561 RepID=A0ABQ3YBP7_9ACTN|nr:hypothetical protein [Actinoplanes deccanensis]GID77397.1 hypothetical protein Ade02nite_60380 [Actinoplanes deccanensis]
MTFDVVAAPADQVPSWLTAVIAGAAAVLGAAVTATASVIAANRKVREIEVAYRQKLRESYLENARKYTESVYVPIAVALTKLTGAFDQYRVHRDAKSHDAEALTAFKEAMADFGSTIDDLQRRGATAFLTSALEVDLQEFVAFISNSLTATSTARQAIVYFNIFGLGAEGVLRSHFWIRHARLMDSWNILPFTPASVHVVRDRVLAADPAAVDFETELVASTGRLRTLVKEVTLGAQARM